jgi:hypothetical protein
MREWETNLWREVDHVGYNNSRIAPTARPICRLVIFLLATAAVDATKLSAMTEGTSIDACIKLFEQSQAANRGSLGFTATNNGQIRRPPRLSEGRKRSRGSIRRRRGKEGMRNTQALQQVATLGLESGVVELSPYALAK